MSKPTSLAWILVVAGLAGCHQSLPCTDCEAADEAEPSVDLPEDTPDLPCGGADLSSDHENCGECGRSCGYPKRGEGTEWEAGGCVDGQCLPNFASCESHYEPMPRTCAEMCFDGTCSANGCAGHTAVFFTGGGDFGPFCDWQLQYPYAEFDGGCDEPLTAPDPDPEQFVEVYVQCCCTYD